MKSNNKIPSHFKIAAVIALILGGFVFSGCQTVKGAGKDIEKAGEKIQGSADRHS